MLDLAAHLWLVLGVTAVALGLRVGVPLAGASVPFAVGAVGTGLFVPSLPLPVAALAAVVLASVAGAVVGVLVVRVDVVGTVAVGLALAFVAERCLTLFPLGSRGATDVALPAAPRLVSPSLGLTWDLTPLTLAAFAGLAVLVTAGVLSRSLADVDGWGSGPEVATAVGVRVAGRRVITLGVAGGLLGLAGAGTEVTTGVVGPSDVGVLLALQLLATGLGARALTSALWGPPAAVGALWLAEQVVSDRVAIAVVLGVVALVPWRRHRTGALPVVGAPESVGPAGLTVEGLTVRYGTEVALDDVSFVVAPGEVHALVGANGSGKTTLLRAVCGAVASTGTVRIGADPLRGSTAARARSGVVRTLQGRSAGALIVVARPRGTLLRQVLGGPAPEEPTTGGGPVALRRAVASGARVLLLDEPAAGTDAAEQAELVAAVEALRASGRTIVLIEHDLEVVRRLATTTTVLDLGRVIATGPTAEVLDRPEVRSAFSGLRA